MSETILFSRGATLKDVPPDYHGISLREYVKREVTRCGEEWRAKQDPRDAPLSKKAIHTPRDSYGV